MTSEEIIAHCKKYGTGDNYAAPFLLLDSFEMGEDTTNGGYYLDGYFDVYYTWDGTGELPEALYDKLLPSEVPRTPYPYVKKIYGNYFYFNRQRQWANAPDITVRPDSGGFKQLFAFDSVMLSLGENDKIIMEEWESGPSENFKGIYFLKNNNFNEIEPQIYDYKLKKVYGKIYKIARK